MPDRASLPERSRRTAGIALLSGVVGCALLAVSYLALSDDGSGDDRRRLREEVESVRVSGARLLSASWDDERHERYIHTGGFDSPAGWTFRYELPEPVPVGEVADAFEDALGGLGWRTAQRDELAGRLSMAHGPEGSHRRLVVDCSVSRESVADEGADSPLRSTSVPMTYQFTVTASLLYEEPPRYGG